MSQGPVRVAFPLIGWGAWTGGYVYLKNTLRLIRSRLGSEVEASVFLSPAEHERYGAELAPLVDGRVLVGPAAEGAGRGRSVVRSLLTGRNAPLSALLASGRADVALEVASFYGAWFPIPVISWLPDFQHRHMPEMFTRANWWRRELGFRTQVMAGRVLMVSSYTAEQDLLRYFPRARGQTNVVRFAIDLNVATYVGRGQQMRAQYDLPPRFFYLPNQFWRHKNHEILVGALSRLRESGRLSSVPPIVLSGLTSDPRNPGHFEQVMSQARAAGLEQSFRHLGLIPYDHVLSLAGCCDALINPSLFEGWSTPIEEAKALGAPLILSDIAIHREQAPDARFFNPRSVEAAAEALLAAGQEGPMVRSPAEQLVAAQDQRLAAHAASLGATIRKAAGSTRRAPSPVL